MNAIEKKLTHDALVENKNRKPMRPNPLAPWELRVGNLRAYYDVLEDWPPQVIILAVGIKVGNRLYIGREEFKL